MFDPDRLGMGKKLVDFQLLLQELKREGRDKDGNEKKQAYPQAT